MILRIIDFSVRNKFLVLLLVGAAAVAGAWSLQRVPLDAIPDLSDTQVIIYSRWDRSPDVIEAPDHLSHRHGDAGRAQGARGPRVLRFWLLVCLRHLRGRHGHLLGAHADAGVPLGRPGPAAAGRQDGAGARCDRAGLGLPVRAGGHVGPAQPGGPALVPGLDAALPPQVGAGRGRGRVGRRLRPPVPGQRRPEQAPQLRPLDPARGRGGARRQHRGGRPADRVRRHRVHDPRARLCPVDRRLREHRGVGERERHADPHPRHRPGRPSARTSGAACRISTARARPCRASSSCARARTPST